MTQPDKPSEGNDEWTCWKCDGKLEYEVPKDYELQGCCSGYECGCMGQPVNPLFCLKCSRKIWPNQTATKKT